MQGTNAPMGFFQMLRRHPIGFWFIFWGELAERCSYYGMMSILARFISEELNLGDAAGNNWVSYFKAACYFLPLLGGFLADQFLGKYRLIVIFSIPYILGHVVLAGETVTYTLIALALLAAGSGVIKPNISTLMGSIYDQQRPGETQLRSLAFGMFYMAINIGAALSYYALPIIRDRYGYSVAFICPAVLMAVSFALFAVGKPFYATEMIQRRSSTPEERREKLDTLKRIGGVFLVVTFFWAIFDQSHTTWVFFARDFTDLTLFGTRISPEQIGVINPLLIILFVPLLTMLWTRVESTGRRVRATDKMMLGFVLTAITMGIMSLAGYASGAFESRPTIRAKSEEAPFILTKPEVDPKAIKEYQAANNAESVPVVTGKHEIHLIWVVQPHPPKITKEPGKIVVAWGEADTERATVTWSDVSLVPKVEENGQVEVKISVPSDNPLLSVEIQGKARAGAKRVVANEDKVTIWWEVIAFIALTVAEVLISVTGLEMAFVVSPPSMKGFVTGLWLLTVGIANLFINAQVGAVYNYLPPGHYFAFLTGLMVAVILAFFFVARAFNKIADAKERAPTTA